MIAILIPSYNEEKNISGTIRATHTVLKGSPHRFYIVDDSSDATPRILTRLARTIPITLVPHPKNRGVSEALLWGIKAIAKRCRRGDSLIIMEADGTSDPQVISLFLSKLASGADVVIASRYVPGGSYKKFPLKRLFLSHAANFTFRYYFPHRQISDYTIFYRAYNIGLIKKALNYYGETLLISKYFTANTELLIKLTDFTKKIAEVPFTYNYSAKAGKSALKVFPNVVQYFKFILGYKLLKPHE